MKHFKTPVTPLSLGKATSVASFSTAITTEMNVGKWHSEMVETIMALRNCRDSVLAPIRCRHDSRH